jgi:hypothetical protein
MVSITHNYLFVQASGGIYSTGSIKARGGVTDDLGDLGLGGGGNLDHLNILSGGNVGIGTTSPTTKFHIKETMTNNADNSLMTIQGDVSDLGTEKVLIDFTMTDTNANNYPQVKIGAAVGQNSDANSLSKEGSGAFVVYTSAGTSDVDGEDNTAERMRVDYQGNVGIGNTSPNHLLHVGDDATATFVTNPDKAIQLSSTTDNEEVAYILYNNEGTNNIRSKYFVDDAIQWVGWDSTYSSGLYGYKWQIAGNDKMALTTAGNLGIGTTSPTTTLDVEGTVSYKHTAFSTAGPTDNIDVSDTTVLEVDTSSNNVIIGGFTGGVQGQILYIVKTNTANFIQLEHNEGGGSQDIFITTGADERVVGYGGYTLYCNGTSWFSLSNPTGGADAG